jgi:hypothetical protein
VTLRLAFADAFEYLQPHCIGGRAPAGNLVAQAQAADAYAELSVE